MADAVSVLDASAMLAYLNKENGWQRIRKVLLDGHVRMSVVNYAEVVNILSRVQRSTEVFREDFSRLDVALVPMDEELAYQTGLLKTRTAPWGLSLADCACLALAKQMNAVALTADSAWAKLKDDFNVELIRHVDVTPTNKDK